MQTLDPGETGGTQTPFQAGGIAADRTRIEVDAAADWQSPEYAAEAAAQRRARRIALLLMFLSAAIMIVAGLVVWLMLLA